jgi:hypothetical protein
MKDVQSIHFLTHHSANQGAQKKRNRCKGRPPEEHLALAW